MSVETNRFEALGDLYLRRYHRLRPGKSEAPEMGRNSMDEDNIERFRKFMREHALNDALDWISVLEESLTRKEEEFDK